MVNSITSLKTVFLLCYHIQTSIELLSNLMHSGSTLIKLAVEKRS